MDGTLRRTINSYPAKKGKESDQPPSTAIAMFMYASLPVGRAPAGLARGQRCSRDRYTSLVEVWRVRQIGRPV